MIYKISPISLYYIDYISPIQDIQKHLMESKSIHLVVNFILTIGKSNFGDKIFILISK